MGHKPTNLTKGTTLYLVVGILQVSLAALLQLQLPLRFWTSSLLSLLSSRLCRRQWRCWCDFVSYLRRCFMMFYCQCYEPTQVNSRDCFDIFWHITILVPCVISWRFSSFTIELGLDFFFSHSVAFIPLILNKYGHLWGYEFTALQEWTYVSRFIQFASTHIVLHVSFAYLRVPTYFKQEFNLVIGRCRWTRVFAADVCSS